VPIEQFRNDAGEIDVGVGDEVKVALDSRRERLRRNRALAREGQARAGVGRAGRSPGSQRHRQGPHQRQGQGRLHRRHQGRPRVPAGFAGRRAPGARPGYLEGKELEFKIIKLDRKRNNVVVSRRAVVESEHSASSASSCWSAAGRRGHHRRGQEPHRLRRVRRSRRHRRPAAHHRHGVEARAHPSEVVNVGDELDVRVLKFDRERNRVARPEAARRGSVGQHRPPLPDQHRAVRQGPTSPITAASSRSKPGVEGLVHVSEMDWTNKNVNPAKVVQVGDESK
jgi:small subunit ribosomal protein S1